MELNAILIAMILGIPALINLFLLIKHYRMIQTANVLLGICVVGIVAVNYCYVCDIVSSVISALIDDPDMLKFSLIPLAFIIFGFAIFQKKRTTSIYLLVHTSVLTLPLIAMENSFFFDNILTSLLSTPLVILILGGVFLYDMIALTVISLSIVSLFQ